MIILSFTLLLFSLLLLLNVVVLFCARFSSLYYSVLRCVFRVHKIFLFGGVDYASEIFLQSLFLLAFFPLFFFPLFSFFKIGSIFCQMAMM